MTGYPWQIGDALLADDLNAAIAGASVPVGGSIQAAIDALPSTGGMVTLSANTTYTLSTQIIITKPNVTIQAPGWNTIIRRAVGTVGHLIDASGDGFVLRDVTVDGNGPANTAGNFEVATNGLNSLVRHCQIKNMGAQGAIALNGAGSRADGNTIIGMGTTHPGYGIWAIGGVKVFITNNHITGTGIDAIGFNGNGSQVIGNHISNCQCSADDATIGGGQICNYSNPALTEAALIEGNYIERGGGALSYGIELYNLNVSVIGNSIRNQRACGINLSYISNIAGSKAGILVSGNTVLNSGQRGSGAPWQLSGLTVFGPLSNIVVTGNRFSDTQATATQSWGVYINPETYNNLLVTDNDLTGNVTGGLLLTGVAGSGHIIANNMNAANAPGVPPVNAANDAAAASAGVLIGGTYRSGSALMVRVV